MPGPHHCRSCGQELSGPVLSPNGAAPLCPRCRQAAIAQPTDREELLRARVRDATSGPVPPSAPGSKPPPRTVAQAAPAAPAALLPPRPVDGRRTGPLPAARPARRLTLSRLVLATLLGTLVGLGLLATWLGSPRAPAPAAAPPGTDELRVLPLEPPARIRVATPGPELQPPAPGPLVPQLPEAAPPPPPAAPAPPATPAARQEQAALAQLHLDGPPSLNKGRLGLLFAADYPASPRRHELLDRLVADALTMAAQGEDRLEEEALGHYLAQGRQAAAMLLAAGASVPDLENRCRQLARAGGEYYLRLRQQHPLDAAEAAAETAALDYLLTVLDHFPAARRDNVNLCREGRRLFAANPQVGRLQARQLELALDFAAQANRPDSTAVDQVLQVGLEAAAEMLAQTPLPEARQDLLFRALARLPDLSHPELVPDLARRMLPVLPDSPRRRDLERQLRQWDPALARRALALALAEAGERFARTRRELPPVDREALAVQQGLGWPLAAPSRSPEQVRQEATRRQEAAVAERFPPAALAEKQQRITELYAPLRVGDQVSLALTSQVRNRVEGLLTSITGDQIIVGNQRVSRQDLSEQDRLRLNPEVCEQLRQNLLHQETAKFEEQRAAEAVRLLRQFTPQVYEESGYFWRHERWCTRSEALDLLVQAEQERRETELRQRVERETLGEAGFAWREGAWVPLGPGQ